MTEVENRPPDVAERYTSAVGASNLRVGDASIRTPGDMIVAAGMNPHRTGLALMRLMTEWDESAKPLPPALATIEQMAAGLTRVPAGEPNAGMVRDVVDGRERFRLPLVVAQEMAAAWYQGELATFLQQLRSLPQVRDALVFWARGHGIEDGVHLVSGVLLWWLHPACMACSGTGKFVIPDTGGRSKKGCKQCGKNHEPGKRKLPYGSDGRRLLAYIGECRRGAGRDLHVRVRQQLGEMPPGM